MKTPTVNVDGRSLTFYEFFGVKETADFNDLKSAYRSLCLKFHPDRNQDKASAEEKFKVIQAVWSVLGNDSRRKEYDNKLARDRGQLQEASIQFVFVRSWTNAGGTMTATNSTGYW